MIGRNQKQIVGSNMRLSSWRQMEINENKTYIKKNQYEET